MVFGLFKILSYDFSPRFRDLDDQRFRGHDARCRDGHVRRGGCGVRGVRVDRQD
nr:Tn3 family transposase [Streptomyces cavernae]